MASLSKEHKVLLVNGYIRENEKSLKLSKFIPKPIITIVFEFQLPIDKWCNKLSCETVNISNDQIIAEVGIQFNTFNIFGDHVVKYEEVFVWNRQILKGKRFSLAIGIAPENKNNSSDSLTLTIHSI